MKKRFFKVMETGLHLDEDRYLGYGFYDLDEANNFINKYNENRDYYEGDIVLYIVCEYQEDGSDING